jgi:undecaprenyl diphosphate synthase
VAVGVRGAGVRPELWPDVDRRVLWRAIEEFAKRDRRYGGAIDAAAP